MSGFRVTYATLTADDEQLQNAYTEASAHVASSLGAEHPLIIDGQRLTRPTFATVSPVDTSLTVGRFAIAEADDVDRAVTAARTAQPAWAATPWQERCDILERAADLISERSIRDGAALSWENGKNRLEAIGEVEETADLIRYASHSMRRHDGFAQPMERFHELEVTSDHLRPYGVWAVIGPFNYPNALTGGPAGAALLAGNAVIIKPAGIGSLSAHLVVDALLDAGVPTGVIHLLS